MLKLATFAIAVGALMLAIVSVSPSSAEAVWRRHYWGGPGVSVYVRPRWYGSGWGWYGPRRYWRSRYPTGYPYAYYPYWRRYYW
jgi:hypothetical protein